MRLLKSNLFFCCIFLTASLFGQKVTIEGYVFEDGNRGYLNVAQVEVLDAASKAVVTKALTNKNGVFMAEVDSGREYIVKVSKKVFEDNEIPISTIGKQPGDAVYVKARMKRKPGYRFEVTLAEQRVEDEPANAIEGATIEVYNNTTEEEVLELINHPQPTFNLNFEQGNHYTIMVRKGGYFVKRMEAYVNVKGCILCFDGVGEVVPGAPPVADVLTEENKQGTLLANVEMQKIKMNEGIKIENLYYHSGSARLRTAARAELDKLVLVLRDNPRLLIEIGSHTDSNGDRGFNQKLSQKRADGVVTYLENKGIDKNRLIAKGYGENKLVNRCKDGVECSDRRHAQNRRTELKVIGYTNEAVATDKSLFEIKEEERIQKLLEEVQSGGQVHIAAGEEIPDYIKNQTSAADIDAKIKAENASVSGSDTNAQEIDAKTRAENAVKQANEQELKVRMQNNTPPPPPQQRPVPEQKQLPAKPKVDQMDDAREVVGATVYKQQPSGKPKPQRPVTKPTKIVKEPVVHTAPEEPELFGHATVPTPTSEGEAPSGRMQGEVRVNTGHTVRKAYDLPASYTGYKIEFHRSPFELPSSHEIFSRHGNIFKEQRKDGSYAYLLGDFKAETNAYDFLESIMKERYPNARVIEYEGGRRKN